MIPFFLTTRLRRIARRPLADSSVKASIRETLVRAGYLPAHTPFLIRFRVAFASAGLLITGLGGMASYVYASDAVLPDTPLYPVRQTLEALEVKLATTPEVRAKVAEKQVLRRKKEAHLLEVLHKPLPALHAKLLKEEREEFRATRASSTPAHFLQPLHLPIIAAPEDRGESHRGESGKRLRQERQEQEENATTTRSHLPQERKRRPILIQENDDLREGLSVTSSTRPPVSIRLKRNVSLGEQEHSNKNRRGHR